MPEARAGRPETCIQSGNLIIDAKGGAHRLRELLERELTARFGFAMDVVVRTAAIGRPMWPLIRSWAIWAL